MDITINKLDIRVYVFMEFLVQENEEYYFYF